MVDWRLARRVATGIASEPEPRALPADLAELCADGERRVVAYARLTPAAPLPAPEAIGRAAWVDANLAAMRGVIEPMAERIAGPPGEGGRLRGAVRDAGGVAMAVETGVLVGLLGQRVLGQYEVAPLDPDGPARLLFVVPNLHQAAERMDVDAASLLRWVALHEVTHGVQFSAVPWLRGHVAGMLRELLDSLELRVDLREAARLATDREALAAFVARVREKGIVTAVVGPERRALLARIQATMALIEGHAEHVMDAAGADALPDLAQLREALDRRRRERPPVMRLLERLLGLEMKLRQYESGKRFCDAVVAEGGVEALNRAWSSPEALPTAAELDDPAAWVARTS
ncbi:MAG TPA: zinc-dependent metalloprotease [Solirubrobacteraceae bacterium]|jgi:coenzyme F420 biosynthesis associated uncharacterized protein|nr:zinc-dependent metalloprotease [Solirubrobacteraceae bacterium]